MSESLRCVLARSLCRGGAVRWQRGGEVGMNRVRREDRAVVGIEGVEFVSQRRRGGCTQGSVGW